MNAVVYARFSSHRQGEQSIEGQVAEAQRFADAHGLTIVKVYADRAQTGRNDNREQFQLMLADAAKHAFDALIVWKTDRIGRNKEEIALNKYHLKKNGVKIYYVAEAIPDTPEGIILEAVIEGMAAYYSEQLSQNVRRGMRASAQKAQATGGIPPLGYAVDENKNFVIDPKHAPTVKLIFKLYAEGKSVTEIANEVNARGLRNQRGNEFSAKSMIRLLKNKKYIGVYSYKDELSMENAIPAIVDRETFDKVQEMMRRNQRTAGRKKAVAEYLLTEKLFCGKCGAPMTGCSGTSKTGTAHHYYVCTAQKKKLCTKKAVRQLWIENLVLEYVVALVQDSEFLEYIAENTYQYYLAQNTDTSYTKSLQKALAETEKSISNLLRAIEAGIFNASTKERLDELEEQKSELKSALAAAKLKENLGLKKEHILFFLNQFGNMDYSDIDCQKRLIKTFVNSVFVYDDKVVLTFNYSGDTRTMTLKEIDAGLQQGVRIPKSNAYQKDQIPFGIWSFCYPERKGLEQSKARLRWSLACRRLDGGNTIIFAIGKNVNESLPVYICKANKDICKTLFNKENPMHKIFGTKENEEYFDRAGAYLIPYRNGQVGVVQTSKGYFLLGGGLEDGESHLDCIKRECIEEVGCVPCVEGKLCSAEAYVTHSTIGYFHPIQTYYYGKLLDREFTPTETDHILCWLEYDQIKGKMFSEMQNWALEQFFVCEK